ncbi:hypothetical protein AsFPU1_3984 [Aphanothece sacrum FPU1]|uniref:GLTT repeat (6 copies) n=2 Tax=Aphanothece sacrum TaxID=1122 RepID=A0A401IMR1_APHSA|nr:hypothetical protein AsFPU1_3984 [Aphanothece sacrum FPU1]GBF84688.1 hypothetical protein AsFPU3_1742 [Aphanothece sacrum FPU3]
MASELKPNKFISMQQTGVCDQKKPKLISIGITPTGYIAIGVTPMGIIAIGIVPMGIISFGAVAMGTIATGVVSMGIAAFGVETMSLLNLGQWQVGPVQLKSEPHNHHHPTQKDSTSDMPGMHH